VSSTLHAVPEAVRLTPPEFRFGDFSTLREALPDLPCASTREGTLDRQAYAVTTSIARRP